MAYDDLNLGKFVGDKSADGGRTGGYRIKRMLQELYTSVDNLAGLTLVAGPVTKLAPGANPTASLTGAAPNYTLNLGLPEGAAGAGAPNSADTLAIAEKDRLERALAAAGVPDEPSLILDFVRGVHFASKAAISASIMTLIAALPGSIFTRATTATYWDIDGLLKTAGANVPRIEYDPVTRLPLGLLAEAGVTNLILRSSDFTNSSWTKAGVTVTAGASVAPDGTTTTSRLTESAVNEVHRVTQSQSVTSGTSYTLSVFAREPAGNANKRYLVLLLPAAQFGGNMRCVVDLATGVATSAESPLSFGATPVGGGVYRCWVTGVATSTAATTVFAIMTDNPSGSFASYTGDGTSAVEMWGSQFEAGSGSGPSSYIPTTVSAVSRGIDSLTVQLPVGFFGSEGTIAVENDGAGGAGYTDLRVGDIAGTNYLLLRRLAAGTAQLYSNVGGSFVVNALALGAMASGNGRIAVGYKAGNYAGSANAATAAASAAATVPADIVRVSVGLPAGASMHLRRVIIHPTRLANSKLQGLSNLSAWS